jgi:hypothetical protein
MSEKGSALFCRLLWLASCYTHPVLHDTLPNKNPEQLKITKIRDWANCLK